MKKALLLIMLSGMGFAAQAAGTVQTDRQTALISECTRLHNGKDYKAALTLLDKIDYSTLSTTQLQEVSYLKATATFATGHKAGRALILQYLDDYPESAKREALSALVAESYYYDRNFEAALKWYDNADISRLEPADRDRADLYQALAMQECGQNEQAVNILSRLRQTSKYHKNDAIFHLAAIDFYNNRLDQAYNGFKSIEMDDKYYLEVPYFLGSIYVKRGEYIRAEKLAKLYLEHNSALPQAIPMQQVLGASYFGQKRYSEAITPLKKYIEGTTKPQRIAFYQLGLSCFQTGKYRDAIAPLEKSTGLSDALTQNAYLH
ncbi:MAG: hypothetical protein IKM47_03475, partial [Bacteroidaceae bacterium]|nr:hypothetical protein [Bacteroidaceae bacterium]